MIVGITINVDGGGEMFGKKVEVRKTIFPFDEGYGVCIVELFKPIVIMSHGLTKVEAETQAEYLRCDIL